MTETATRSQRRRPARQDWRRHLLALVLLAVLVWYTVVSPSYAAAPARATELDSQDAEGRELEERAEAGFAGQRLVTTRPGEFKARDEDDELDWPEIIGDD